MRLGVRVPPVRLSLERLEREDVAVDEGQRAHELLRHSSGAQHFSHVRLVEIVRAAAVRVAAASSDEALAHVQPRALLSVRTVSTPPSPSVVRDAQLRNRATRWIRLGRRVCRFSNFSDYSSNFFMHLATNLFGNFQQL